MIILCVPNSPEVVEVVDAMLPVLGEGKTVVDCSTIDPEVERAQRAGSSAPAPPTWTPRYRVGPLARRRAP